MSEKVNWSWLKERYDGKDGQLWRKVRRLFLFDLSIGSALNLFKINHAQVQKQLDKNQVILRSKIVPSKPDDPSDDQRLHLKWRDDSRSSIRILLDQIVTRWKTDYLPREKLDMETLHESLTDKPLNTVQQSYHDIDEYQITLTMLHYHEIWIELQKEYIQMKPENQDRVYHLQTEYYCPTKSFDQQNVASLLFASSTFTMLDHYDPGRDHLCLFDVMIIKMNRNSYFAVVVHAETNRVKNKDENRSTHERGEADENDVELRFEIRQTICLYMSKECADSIKDFHERTNSKLFSMVKLTNITSQRRMISAVNNLGSWSSCMSIIQPTIDDPFLALPTDFEPDKVQCLPRLNETQSRAVAIAEAMMADLNEHIHLIHGPPGTGKSQTIARIVFQLVKKGGKHMKILVCAPSNNAADELCRRIIKEFNDEEEQLSKGTLLRIACKPSNDSEVNNYFLDFLIMEAIFDELKCNSYPDTNNIKFRKEKSFMRKAKIFISTLNYSGMQQFRSLKSPDNFLIIDEACQSLESDSLIPLQYEFGKILLVGDPKQLNPCVLSKVGKSYGLAQSLYSRLYESFGEKRSEFVTLLDTQYRMDPNICSLASNSFYGGLLKTGNIRETNFQYSKLRPLFFLDVRGRVQEQDQTGSSYNRDEVAFVEKLCYVLTSYLATQKTIQDANNNEAQSRNKSSEQSDDDRDSETDEIIFNAVSYKDPRSIEVQKRIAVITPYKAQLNRLRKNLPCDIEILTADSSQGREKDIIILSCVRNDQTIGFLKDQNRLNVMLTRAKIGLYVVGDFKSLESIDKTWKQLIDDVHQKELIRTFSSAAQQTCQSLLNTLIEMAE